MVTNVRGVFPLTSNKLVLVGVPRELNIFPRIIRTCSVQSSSACPFYRSLLIDGSYSIASMKGGVGTGRAEIVSTLTSAYDKFKLN